MNEDDDGEDDAKMKDVLAARERLKNKGKPTSSSGKSLAAAEPAKPPSEGKELRTWVSVSDKISKKDMEKIDVSKDKGGEMDLDHQKSIYLGGDDDKLEGFYNSDDEIDFEKFIKGGKSGQKQGGGLFSKLTSAFQTIAGNKVLSEDDVEAVIKNFKSNLMEKNVANEIADSLCKSVTATLIDRRTENFTSVKTTVKNALTESI